MSHLDWLFMYESYRKREEEARKERSDIINEVYRASTKAFRDTLIYVTGANYGAGRAKTPDGPTPFIPLLFTFADPEVVEELTKRESEDTVEENVMTNPAIDELNEALMELDDADLEPIFTGANSDDPFERWASKDTQAALRMLGVDTAQDGDLAALYGLSDDDPYAQALGLKE